jgi:ketosteroid isomerase-like protein
MPEHPNVVATRAGIEAFAKGDAAKMADGLADDAVWHVPGSNRFSGEFRGKAAVLDRFRRMGESGLSTRIEEIHDVVGGDEHVVALVTLSVVSADATVTTHAVWVMHVRDGTMHEFWGMNADQAGIDGVIG